MTSAKRRATSNKGLSWTILASLKSTALTKSYGPMPVVRDVSLRCEPGTITGFLGANGAGKSTTMKMIVGLVRPDRGTATIDGPGTPLQVLTSTNRLYDN